MKKLNKLLRYKFLDLTSIYVIFFVLICTYMSVFNRLDSFSRLFI